MTVNQIGIFIKNTRGTFGISQSKLSEMVGVDVSLICRIENGTRSPSRKTITKLATVLAVTQQDLLRLAGLPLRKRKAKRSEHRKTVADSRVGTYIKSMRQALGLSQSALAQAAEVHATAVSNFEQFRRLPSKKTFGRILQALGTNEPEMMALTGSHDGDGEGHDDNTIMLGQIDPLAAMALRQKPVETQRLVVDLLLAMKLVAETLKRPLAR